jgi:RHS repeat-associated protein
VAALSYDPTAPAPGHLKVKWVSPTTSIQKARPDGSLYSPVNRLTNYVHFTVARLSPGEPPSVLWGRDFPSTGGTCADVIPGKTDAFCRVVTVHSGIDGSISQRFYYAPPNQTSPGSWGLSEQQSLGGFGAPIVADLMGTGQASILFNGTVWDRAGNVQLELDGTGSPSTANDSVVVDLDGDGKPDILTLNNIRNFYVTDSALRAFRMDGTLLWHLPVAQASRPGRMSVADVDRDGTPEILFQSDNQLWCVDHAGHIKWVHVFDSGVYGGWYTNPGQITRTPVYDLNGDGLLEVVVQYGNNDLIFLRGDDGQTELSWRIPGDVFAIPYSGDYEPVVVDLDGDGHAEIVFLHAASAHAPNGVVVIQGDTVPWRAAPKAFNQRAFNGVNINADSSIPLQPITYWTNAATNVFEQPPPEPYVVDPRLTTQTSFTYAAGLAGRASSDPATVSIDLIPGNRPPVVTSTPPASVNTVGMSYTNPFTYQITAYDPDPGDTLSYAVSFISYGSPTIVTVSPTGLFSYKDYWQPTGLCTYIVDVKDNHGAVTQHTFMIFFTSPSENKTVPNLVGQTATAAAGLLAAVDLQVGVVTHVDNSAPAGQVLSQNPASGTSVLKRSTVDFMVSNGPAVVLPPGPPPQLGNLAKIVVTPSMASRVTGETASFKAIGTNADGTGADITAFVTWSSSEASVAAVDAAGTAHASGAGTTTVTATANGLTGSATLTVVTRVPGDVIPPTAIITSPADGGTVTALAQIIGTASDANFLRYQLAAAPAGDTTWTVIGEGINAVTDGTLGTFDPTILLNDLFTLRLSVFDRNGNETIATSTVQVSGALKVGLFSLTFTDLNIPMAGIPITVTRTYDSRDKAKGDFGIGWRLGVQTLRIRTNRVPGTGWVRNQSGSIIGLVPTSEHKVSVTLPDGKVEEFDLVLSPTSGFGGLDATTVTGYAPRPGTLGKLEMLDNPYLFILNGATEDELVDDTTLKTFEPLHYRYTTLDGTQIEIDRKEGVKKVTDINGNSMTFGPAGIIHSSGKSVTFARDAQNRITKITDSDGNSRTYAYNASGDLVTATDFVDNATGFTYNGAHGLVDINDPAGKRVSRNEYDDAGRVIATTDAQGNRIELMHNLNTQQEIVRDRLGNITVFEYDAAGNIVAKTDALGGRTTYSYDSRGNQLTQTDPLGRISTKTYDAANHVLSSTDFDGNTTTSTYNAFGQSLTRTTPEGHTTTHAYDAKGNLTQVTDPEGGVTRHTYNSTGGRLSTTDPFGNVTEFVLDASGNTITEIDTLGNVTSYTYNANGLRLTQTKPGGRVTQYAYDAMGRMIRTTDALGQQSSVTYSAIGDGKKPATGTNEMGQITVFDYDALGNLLQTMSPDGSSSTATYDAEGRTTSKTNRDGHTTTFQYDALGRQTRTIHPDGTSMMKTYDAVGRILAETDERGHSSTYSYAPNQQNVTDALGNVTVHRFDSQGRRLRMTDALGRVTTFAYNSKGNVLLTTLPDGSTTMTAYDAVGRKIADTDQAGQTTQFDYDAAGRLIRVTDATGSVTIYTYDPVGNRLSQTDANGHTTRMTYDVLNRMTSRIRPLGQQETFGYDAVGNQTTHTDFNGQITTFVFNSNNQLIRKNFSDGNAVNYAYTSEGLRLQAGGDTYTYDRRSRMLEEQKTSGAVIAYTYDATGNRTSVTSSQGTITYTYDVLNRLNSVVDVTGTTTYAYEAAGNLASMVYPNGVTTTYTYDTLNRLIQMSSRGPAGLIASYSYTLAPTGNRVRVIEAGPATTGRIVSYAYDNVYRLTQEKIDEPGTTSDQTITYNYDTIGNRTQMNRNGVLTTYAYDANDRLLTETSGALTLASTYDNNGNLKTRGDSTVTDSYAYNAENRLVTAQVQSGANPGPVAYSYDADGIRTGIKAGGVTTTFLVDKNTDYAQAISETVGATTATYTYGNSQIISQTRLGEGTHFYLADGHQSTRQLTDSLGAVSASYTYDAFGVQLQASGTTSNDFLYTGEQFDPNIGFYYLRARYYSQKTGRFVSTDAYEGNIFDPISLHRYLYAHGNPVDMRDPSGNATLSEIGAASFISGSIGATASLAALGVKAWTGQPVTWADAGRAIATGFAIGAIGGAIAESAYAIGAAGQVINTGRILFSAFTVAALNTANQVFFIHKRQDVTYSDVSTQAIMNGVIQGLGFGAGEAFQMVGKTIHGIASTGAVNVAIGGFVKSGPKDSLIVWRKQDRCPTNIWYDKSSDGSYKVNRSDVPVAGCNVIDLVVKFYALEF